MADLRRSLVITFFSSSGATLMRFAVSVVLAYLLTPSEIGIYSMTVVFVNLAHVFRDFGVSTYLQREPELTPDKIRSATGVVFTTSWLIAIGLFLSSESIGLWFKEPEMIPVMQVLSIGFLLIPFGAITNALLTREFAAEKQAIVNIIGTTSFCVACVAFAALGHGPVSLAYANLVNIIVCAIAYIPYRPKGIPWLPSFAHWRSVTHFGLGSLLSSCMVALNNALPDLLLGKLGSAHHVGLLSRANSTVTIFTHIAGSTVSYGAVSYLAQAHHRGESLVPVLSRATSLLTGVGWTALALTTVLGKDIVQALYSDVWLECVPAILPLSLAAAVTMAFHYVPFAVTAIGRPYLSAFPVAATLLARIAFAVVLFDGTLAGFGWVLCLATVAAAPITLLQQRRHLGFGALDLLRALLPSALVAAGTAAVAALLALALPSQLAPLVRLLLMFPVLALAWYLLLRASSHPVLDEVHRLGGMARARLALLRPNV
ncbi:oligosaccharide flippase family protein [Massilia sp. BHUDP2]|uniref:oligosaccharide flippase family protein n=1 Tax=Massilia sp. BHUDP2 TaxID=3034505 RepID=UPI001AE7D2DA